MRDLTIWRAELIDEIRTIADLDGLQRLWLGKDEGAISSFEEEVAHIFDDYQIDDFLRLPKESTKLSAEQTSALVRFRDCFSSFLASPRAKPYADREILKDPKWHEVVTRAKEFIDRVDEASAPTAQGKPNR